MIQDVFRQPNAADPVLGEAAVLELVRRHVSGANAVTAVDESGGEARAYMVDDDVVLKTQRPHRLRPRTSLEKEAFFLRNIAAHSDVSVPRVLGYGREGDVEYLCMTRMAGTAARRQQPEGEVRRLLLFDLGRTLRRLHGLPQAGLLSSPLIPGDRQGGDLRRRLESMAGQATGWFGREPAAWPLKEAPDSVAARLLSITEGSDLTAALHSNPGPEHTFIDTDSLRFTGLIDFGDSYISHPALDLRSWPSLTDRRAVLDGYVSDGDLPPGFEDTWRAVMALSDMAAFALRPERRDAYRANLVEISAHLG